MGNGVLLKTCVLALFSVYTVSYELLPYYHAVEENPGLVFAKSKEIVFIKEKRSVMTAINTSFIKSIAIEGRAQLAILKGAYSRMRNLNDTAVQYINTLNVELDSLESLIGNLRKSELFYELVVIPRGEDYHVLPTRAPGSWHLIKIIIKYYCIIGSRGKNAFKICNFQVCATFGF